MSDNHGYENLDAKGLEKMLASKGLDAFSLVDVRQPEEYKGGHIPGARLLPLGDVEGELERLEPENGKDVVFYCAGGKRSAMAARLAVNSGRFTGRIFSLDGGFGGWQGMALPDFPNVALFSEADSLQDKLLRAMEQEKGAMRLYQSVLEAATGKIICSLMHELASFEEGHARVVYTHLKRAWQKDTPLDDFETLFDSLRGDVLEGGRSLDDLDPWIEDARSGSCINLAELAMELEMSALDLYENLALQQDDPEARKVFESLANQELGHARLLMKHLDDFMQPLDASETGGATSA